MEQADKPGCAGLELQPKRTQTRGSGPEKEATKLEELSFLKVGMTSYRIQHRIVVIFFFFAKSKVNLENNSKLKIKTLP